MDNRQSTIIRLLTLITLSLTLLVACTGQSNDNVITDDEAQEILLTAVNNLSELASFRLSVEQGGVPYYFNFALGPGQDEFVTNMTSAEGAFIAPDNLSANARIQFRGLLVNVGLFATSEGQWLSPLNAAWVPYVYAEGFDPGEMMGDESGFTSAINAMTNVTYTGTEMLDGLEVVHVQGNATGDIVNELLFGLVEIFAPVTDVDVYIDPIEEIPVRLKLTVPESADSENGDTFWDISIYDPNTLIEVDTPMGVDATVVLPDEPLIDAPNWLQTIFWVLGLSSIFGAVVTPYVYHRKQRSVANAVVIGALVGAIGSLILLIPLWLLIPEMKERPSTTNQSAINSEELKHINPWIVMAFISIPVFVGSLDLTVVSVFLPDLISELGLPFDTALDDASWIVTVYLLAYTVSLTFTGRLSDLLGRRVIYVISLLVFIVGSVLVAIALSTPTDLLYDFYVLLGQRPDRAYVGLQVIIFGRTVQALGAGALVPVSLALVGDIFPPDKRARPLGFVAAMDTLGWVLGPVYGGIFLQIMPWQGLFWMNVPLTFLALFSVLYALRKLTMMKVNGIFDMLGTVLIVGSLSALSIGLGASVDPGSSSINVEDLQPLPDYALPLVTVAIGLFIAFIVVETRVKDPLVNLKMFLRRNLASAAIVNLLVGYCLFIGLVSVPLLVNLQIADLESDVALRVGLMLSTLTLPMAFAAVPGGWLSDRIGVKQTIILGLVLSLIGFAIVWQTWTIDIAQWAVGIQMALVGIGIGLTFSPVSTAIINSATDSERGVAGAVVLILRLLGMTISTSSLSSLSFYRVDRIVDTFFAGTQTIDPSVFASVYTDAVMQVLREIGLIGAILVGIAIIPAFFIDKVITLPDDANE